MMKRLENLLTIKSLVTLAVVGVFSYLALKGTIPVEQFMPIVITVIAFYFGTQHEKGDKK